MMIAGTVSVDDNGNETFVPNNGSNAAMQLYTLLLKNEQSNTVPQPSFTPPTVTVDSNFNLTVTKATYKNTDTKVTDAMPPSAQAAFSTNMKKSAAATANLFAAWMVNYIQANATVTGAVDTTVSNANQPLKSGVVQ
jgi:hypothetical protein